MTEATSEIQAQGGQPDPTNLAPAAPSQGEPTLPEKFKGKPLEDIVKSYENLEAEHTRARMALREKEQQVGIYEQALRSTQSQQQQPQRESEDQIFMREWEQDPARATYNQSQRSLQKAAALNNQTASSLFYNTVKNDDKNYPDFNELEPRMMEIARENADIIKPDMLNSPRVINLLYKQAKSENINDNVSKARIQGQIEAESRRKEIKAAQFENPTPISASNISSQDKTIEQLEKELPWHTR